MDPGLITSMFNIEADILISLASNDYTGANDPATLLAGYQELKDAADALSAQMEAYIALLQ